MSQLGATLLTKKDLESVVTVLAEALKITQENRHLLEQFVTTFTTVEKGCSVMHEFIMKEKERSDELEKRIERLENEKDNPRQPAQN